MDMNLLKRNHFNDENFISDKNAQSLTQHSFVTKEVNRNSSFDIFNQFIANAVTSSSTHLTPSELNKTNASITSSMFPFCVFLPQYLSTDKSSRVWSPPSSPDSCAEKRGKS